MGKRKKASKPPPKKSKETLDTVFQCLFCNHEKSVSVKMEKKLGVGQLSCKVCGQHFQTGINYLSAPVDVYSEWIDACDAVAKDAAGATRMTGAPPMQKLDKVGQDGHEGSTGEMDDFIEVDEADAEGEFAEE